MGQESEVGKEAGVVWEVYARVSGAACWEMGVMIWMQFKEAVMLELGNFLFQIWVFCFKFGLGFKYLGGSGTFGVLGNAAIMLADRSSIAAARWLIAWKNGENVSCIQ